MPFKGVDVMDVKKEFVLKSLDKDVNFTELCREYGISTKQATNEDTDSSMKVIQVLLNIQDSRRKPCSGDPQAFYFSWTERQSVFLTARFRP